MPEHLNSGVGSGRGQLTEQTVDWPSCYCGQVLRVSAYPPPCLVTEILLSASFSPLLFHVGDERLFPASVSLPVKELLHGVGHH